MTKITTDADAMNAIKEAMNYAPEDLRNKAWTAFAYLSARLASTSPAPDGWVLVPREPNIAMMDAGEDSGFRGYNGAWMLTPDGVYRAMIAAAPQPVVEKDNG